MAAMQIKRNANRTAETELLSAENYKTHKQRKTKTGLTHKEVYYFP
jgi:hypothetical protein